MNLETKALFCLLISTAFAGCAEIGASHGSWPLAVGCGLVSILFAIQAGADTIANAIKK